jgi:hypothetical protein
MLPPGEAKINELNLREGSIIGPKFGIKKGGHFKK